MMTRRTESTPHLRFLRAMAKGRDFPTGIGSVPVGGDCDDMPVSLWNVPAMRTGEAGRPQTGGCSHYRTIAAFGYSGDPRNDMSLLSDVGDRVDVDPPR